MTAVAEIARGHDLPGLPDRPLAVDEYHALIARGTLEEGAPFELLEGWLIEKLSRGPRHDTIAMCLFRLLLQMLPRGWHVRSQCALTALESEPEPDCVVVQGAEMDYLDRHPGPRETALAIEVSKSSLRRDRVWKSRIYARSGIPTYWIVNLTGNVVEVYTEPTIGSDGEPTYAVHRDYRTGESVPVVLEGREVGSIAAAELLPPSSGGSES